MFSLLAAVSFVAMNEVQSFSSPLSFGRISSKSSVSSNRQLFNTPKSAILLMNANGDDSNTSASVGLGLTESDRTVLGAGGIIMSFVMLYSEYVLKMTGCGLPAGPFGLVGAVEGLSYLGVAGLVAFSIYTKVKTVSVVLISLPFTNNFPLIFSGMILFDHLSWKLGERFTSRRIWIAGSSRRSCLPRYSIWCDRLDIASDQLWLHTKRSSNGRRNVPIGGLIHFICMKAIEL